MSNDDENLIADAEHAARLTHEQVAQHVGASKRSVQRWVSREGTPMPSHYQKLAPVVFPVEPELAARAGGTTLEALGLVKPAPPPPAPNLVQKAPDPPPPPRLTMEQIDAVVCAIAERHGMKPGDAREIADVAFTRAAKLGYATEAIARAFEEARAARSVPPQPPGPAQKG